MIKVCHISSAHPPFDVRIFHKECVSLAQAGFDVSLVITHDKHETVQGVKMIPLPPTKGRIHRMVIKTHFAFYRALKTKSKIYHFHDPELMIAGILLKIMGKKVIFDSHENVSSQIENKSWIGNKPVRLLVKNCYRLFEKFAILFYDTVISVTPEIVEFLSPKKGFLVRNYPIISLIENQGSRTEEKETTTLIYAGGLTKIRGIKEICEAVKLTEKNVELILLGNWESEKFKNECLTNKNKVKYLGVLPLKEVYPMMKNADLGMATLYPEKNHLNSLPIKAFEYMACNLPILMSNFPYWVNTFEGCAMFVDPNSVEAIKEKIEWFVDHKESGKEMGRFGNAEVKRKYSWEEESKELVNMYKSILK